MGGRPCASSALPAPDRQGVAGRHDARTPGSWFPSPVEVDLQPVARCASAPSKASGAATGTVETVDPPRRLSFTWGADRLTFELAPDGDGTTVRADPLVRRPLRRAQLRHRLGDVPRRAARACWPASRYRRPTGASPATRSSSTSSDSIGREVTEAGGRVDGARRAAAHLPGRGGVGPVVRHGPRHRRAARCAGRR